MDNIVKKNLIETAMECLKARDGKVTVLRTSDTATGMKLATDVINKCQIGGQVDCVHFKVLNVNGEIPVQQTDMAAGVDIKASEAVILKPMEPTLVPTGLAVQMPAHMEAQVRPRSGLATQGITVFNSPGTIDADYRGEIKVILINIRKEDFIVTKGMRIAQLVFQKLPEIKIVSAESLDNTVRGTGGFGSTGL